MISSLLEFNNKFRIFSESNKSSNTTNSVSNVDNNPTIPNANLIPNPIPNPIPTPIQPTMNEIDLTTALLNLSMQAQPQTRKRFKMVDFIM